MKILAKLLTGFIAVALLCGIVGVVGIMQISNLDESLMRVSEESIPTIDLLNVIDVELTNLKAAMRTIVHPYGVEDDEWYERQLANVEKYRAAYQEALKKFEVIPMIPEEKKLYDALGPLFEKAIAYNNAILAKVAKARTVPVEEREAIFRDLYGMISGDQRLVMDNLIAELRKLLDFDEQFYGVDMPKQAMANADAGIVVLIIVTALAFIVALLLGIMLGTSISNALRKSVAILDKVAAGDISEKMVVRSNDEFKQVAASLNLVMENVGALVAEAGMLTKAAVEGRVSTRGNADKLKGGYRDIVVGVNEIIDALVGFLDNMPAPAMLIDADFQILFMNKAGAAIGNTTGDQLVKTRKKCFDYFKTGDCKSQNCACSKAMQLGSEVNSETVATPLDVNYEISYTGVPVRDKEGKIVGAFEVITDQTAVKVAERKMKKIAGFQNTEIERLNGNLQKIAHGDLSCDFTVADADADTRETKELFDTIAKVLNQSTDAIGALVSDAGMLAQAAVEGRLATRADAGKHQGDFRRIVDGVNKTLDLVITPVNETIAILKRMAEGDLTATMTGDYKGDFDILKTALNGTLDSINDILGQVTAAVEQVTAGSQQVSQASQSLSQGATEQASSLEEITSSVTEIAGQTRQNTDSAVQVNGLAKTAKQDAEQGNVQMKDLVSAMSDINKSAEEIKKIVKAIDDISFQINLLALNANVEAARAGKYGKGFAVVAEEVRNLAVRSAGSVKETTAMVDEAIANIGKGNALVDVTAKQLISIMDGAGKVAGLAEEVATASREQSQGLEQITTGLAQIDQVTQANTASAEQSASAAEELSSQSQQLKGMITRFKLKEKESRMTEAQMLAMLRAEIAGKGGAQHAGHPAAGIPPAAKPRALALHTGGAREDAGTACKAGGAVRRLVNPADVISLDDEDFGKF
ncbi:MAG: hypothetical protein A2001_08945 [Treponema sp. GWC1_61_84]|nr:MAG: hypothetical protein A2001_08945 [Treponema sp. GWC1_61_84]